MMQQTLKITIPANHPSLAGHFPGHPVIPGVVALNYVFDALSSKIKNIGIDSLIKIKFLAIIEPNETLELTYQSLANHCLKFTATAKEKTKIVGTIKLASHAT